MAKRFTDTGKWGKASFTELSNEWKLVWIYLCDSCDHAGIWDVNWKLMAFHLGQPFSRALLEQAFGDKIRFLSETKLFLPSFIEFQYGTLNPDNRAHLSVINRLEKEGANKGLKRSLQGRKDKDKDKDTVKDKEKEKEAFNNFWKDYPNKVEKQKAEEIYGRLFRAGVDPATLIAARDRYREQCKTKGTASDFVKMPTTFLNNYKSFLADDYGAAEDFSKGEADADYLAKEAAIFARQEPA